METVDRGAIGPPKNFSPGAPKNLNFSWAGLVCRSPRGSRTLFGWTCVAVVLVGVGSHLGIVRAGVELTGLYKLKLGLRFTSPGFLFKPIPRMGDWSALPWEILCLVADRLALVDYVRFGAACVSWRKAVAGRRRHPPLRPQPPWLMYVTDRGARFFCLADRRSYRLDLPEPPVRDRLLFASAGGWVLTAGEASEMHLLNPITGVQVRLPSTTPTIGPLSNTRRHECRYDKVALSHSPSSSDWTAVLSRYPYYGALFARAGDRAWTVLYDDYIVADVIYHQGLFYTLQTWPGTTIAWDLSGPSPRSEDVGPPSQPESDAYDSYDYPYVSRCLVESGGHLLQVWRKEDYYPSSEEDYYPSSEDDDYMSEEDDNGYSSEEDDDYSREERTRRNSPRMRTLGFDVFRLDERKRRWIRVRSLGERALFLGRNSSMSLSTLEYPELRRNCIYFTDVGEFYDVGVYDMEDRSIEPCGPNNDHLNEPLAVWIMPCLS